MPQMVVWPFMGAHHGRGGVARQDRRFADRHLRKGQANRPQKRCFKNFLRFFSPVPICLAEGVAGARLFGWERKAEIKQRAEKVARMLSFIKHSMQSKTYEQFVTYFSNPGDEPDVLKRYDRRAHFVMHMSTSCWYRADVAFPHQPDGIGSVTLQGGGDDFGVLITAAPADDRASVALHMAFDQKAGRDAKGIVRMLEAMPHWTHGKEAERDLGMEL